MQLTTCGKFVLDGRGESEKRVLVLDKLPGFIDGQALHAPEDRLLPEEAEKELRLIQALVPHIDEDEAAGDAQRFQVYSGDGAIGLSQRRRG